ncbi:MAG TPA: dicarboxylate/amino acid:cation symporter [Pirellulales bacterium]|nr:dicarboxylate/amino acid:cation symporter [Pirellulales bacterium]
MTEPRAAASNSGEPRGGLGWWTSKPLYLRIGWGLALGLAVGAALNFYLSGQTPPDLAAASAAEKQAYERAASRVAAATALLGTPGDLVMRLLGALAPPLILLAVVHTLLKAEIPGRMRTRLVGLLLLNTLVAITIGLLVANVVQPGRWNRLIPEETERASAPQAAVNPLIQFLDNIPKSIFGPLGDEGKVIGVIFLAVAFGVALRRIEHPRKQLVEDLLEIALACFLEVLGWLVEIIPLAVFGIVARIVGERGFADFLSLGAFVFAVLLGLALQAGYYLARVRAGSWVRPGQLLRGCRDALVMAFSTASSTVTMPETFVCLKDRVGLREESASLGALVGANFNNDGTALYEAMAALFISQMIGRQLGLPDQLMIVLTSVVASVGAAGIPQAGLVTMMMVFGAVGLPVEYIPILLTVDWFLDRCRTAINVMGDMNVSCLLEGRVRGQAAAGSEQRTIAEEVREVSG